MLFFACSQHEKEFKEENKILHAGPSSGGIGSLSFGLYNDSTYSISNSGGIGENVCTGTYSLNDNVIIFNNLDASSALKYNRLLILRNSGQDSLYWKNIYPPNSLLKWKQYRWQDSVKGSKGEIYQLNKYNQIATDEAHFIIRLDSLKKKISTID
ncbi:hypothetical protein GCM10027043_09660 [Ferruginibacter profundus]